MPEVRQSSFALLGDLTKVCVNLFFLLVKILRTPFEQVSS